MAPSLKRVYWDACAWIALIQREKIRDEKGVVTEDRDTMCRTVWTAAQKDKTVEIVTSALSLVEVCKSKGVVAEGDSKIAAFFEHPHIEMVNLDRFVGERARELMLAGHPGLKPPDATHVATAALGNVDEMHTFDDKLLNLTGKIFRADGAYLKICKPDAGGPMPLLTSVPLLDNLEPADADDIDLSEELGQGEVHTDTRPAIDDDQHIQSERPLSPDGGSGAPIAVREQPSADDKA